MKITPLEIRKAEFQRVLRGYDPDEVETLLGMVADQLEELVKRTRAQDERTRELEEELAGFREKQELLQEALIAAREAANAQVAQANREAELIIGRGKAEADQLLMEAHRNVAEARSELIRLQEERAQLLSRLRSFLAGELRHLAGEEGGSASAEADEENQSASGPGMQEKGG